MSKDNINLPKTAFSMKANLPIKEPDLIEFWNKINLYQKLREDSKGKEKFVLHDGPPYANGNIHMGTALNKILKDIITKFHQMDGKDSVYVPGWDCHGLPIEWKIEEQYKKNKKNKNEVPSVISPAYFSRSPQVLSPTLLLRASFLQRQKIEACPYRRLCCANCLRECNPVHSMR